MAAEQTSSTQARLQTKTLLIFVAFRVFTGVDPLTENKYILSACEIIFFIHGSYHKTS